MKRILLLVALVGVFIVNGCKKDDAPVDPVIDNIDDLVVPANFDWASSRDVSLNVAVSDARFGSNVHVISVYAGNPDNGGTLLSKGSASLIKSFTTRIYLPSVLNELYLVKTAPDGSKISRAIEVISPTISVSMSAQGITNVVSSTSAGKAQLFSLMGASVSAETSPDCSSGCGIAYATSPNSPFDLNNGTTYCITGDGVNVNIQNTNGGTLRICGKNVTVSGLKITSNVTVIVTSTGSVNFSNLNWDGSGTFKNFGMVSTGNFKVNSGTFVNQGTFNINGTFTVATGTTSTNTGTIHSTGNFDTDGSFVSSGTLTIDGTTEFKSNSNFTNEAGGVVTLKGNTSINNKLTNSGTLNWTAGEVSFNNNPTVTNNKDFVANSSKLTVTGNFTNNGSVSVKTLQHNSGNGVLVNNCKFVVLEDAGFDKQVDNHSYFQVGRDALCNSSFRLNMYNSAMFRTGTLSTMDGIVKGTGSTSLFKVVSSSGAKVNDNGSNKFQGAIQYCDPSRTIKPSQFTGGATQSCDAYIAVNECNPVGNGTAPRKDTDKDGIYDDEDDYPNDIAKAFNNPQFNYNEGGSTVAFEDRWPEKGDFDLNDVVLSYRYNIVTNADNKVVQINADYKLLATGGNLQNGAGIQFHIPASNVVSIVGAQLEPEQDSAVVILFNNSRQEQSNWNTTTETRAALKEYKISVNIKNGPALSAFGIGNYNVFIWNNTAGYGRGFETHLPGKPATKKANALLFGTKDDNSKAGKLYTTTKGLPWALEVPIANYAYPLERSDITQVYLKFGNWAISGGESFKDWYSNTSPQYRKQDKIFQP